MMGKRAVTSLKAQKEFRWTWVKYGIAIAIIALASFLLYRTLSGYSLNDIVQSIKAIPPSRLLLAGLFAAGSYFCLSWQTALLVSRSKCAASKSGASGLIVANERRMISVTFIGISHMTWSAQHHAPNVIRIARSSRYRRFGGYAHEIKPT